MLVLCSCVTALQMGPLLPSNDPLRMAAPITAAEIWVEPPNINLMTESLEQGVASSRGSVPMIFWKSMPLSQTGSEAPPPYGASTGVASWYAHAHATYYGGENVYMCTATPVLVTTVEVLVCTGHCNARASQPWSTQGNHAAACTAVVDDPTR